MDFVGFFLDLANVINLVACVLLMRSVIRDRNVLRGFSISGSILTFFAIFFFEIAYLFLDNLVSFGLGLIPISFWLLVSIFTVRKWVYDHNSG